MGLDRREESSIARHPSSSDVEADLARLDPWTFWTLPGTGFDVDHVVVGTTGVFAIRLSPDPARIDGRGDLVLPTRGLRRLRKATRRIRRHLTAATVYVDTTPVLCVGGKLDFAPRDVRGVRVVPRSLLVRDLVDRPRAISPNQARRGALALRKLGAGIAFVHLGGTPEA